MMQHYFGNPQGFACTANTRAYGAVYVAVSWANRTMFHKGKYILFFMHEQVLVKYSL